MLRNIRAAGQRYWKVGAAGAAIAFRGSWLQTLRIPSQSDWLISLLVGAPEFSGGVLINVGSGLVGFFILLTVIEGKLRNDLVQDVVRHSLGYLLPDELRVVMQKLYDQKIVCTESQTILTVTPTENGLVMIESDSTRELKNVTDRPVEQAVSIEIDDWLSEEYPPQVLAMSSCFEKGSDPLDHLAGWSAPQRKPGERMRLVVQSAPRTIPPEKTLQIKIRWQKTLKDEDTYIGVVLTPTRAPKFTVNVVALNHHLSVGDSKALVRNDNLYTFHDTLLPCQAIALRWWKKSEGSEGAPAREIDRPSDAQATTASLDGQNTGAMSSP